jgi:hypothetical protein
VFFCLLIAGSALLVGCSQSVLDQRPADMPEKVNGIVHGGQQPVTGATIQLYTVGTTGDGSAATPLLTTAVTTSDGSGSMNANANAGNAFNTMPAGGFIVTGLYTCPSPNAYVYFTASGGNPGLTSGTNNSAIQMFAMMGQCGSLSSQTYLVIDEVTTVGGLAALYPYTTSLSGIGYNSGSDDSAFAAAASAVNEYVNSATGVAPGPSLPSNYYASSNEIDALADVMAACVNSDGSTTSGSPCQQFFADATPGATAPTNVLNAMLNVLINPTLNTSAIYNLIPANSPFQPMSSTAPSAWTLPILPLAATPTFSPPGGTYTASGVYGLVTTATSTTPSSIIYCALNAAPTTASQVEDQSQGIPVGSETVECIATASGYATSNVESATYNVVLPAPVIQLPSGTYGGTQTAVITPSVGFSGFSDIYYTTNGGPPTSFSTHYTGPVVISQSETLKAISYRSGYTTSAVTTATYTIY